MMKAIRVARHPLARASPNNWEAVLVLLLFMGKAAVKIIGLFVDLTDADLQFGDEGLDLVEVFLVVAMIKPAACLVEDPGKGPQTRVGWEGWVRDHRLFSRKARMAMRE